MIKTGCNYIIIMFKCWCMQYGVKKETLCIHKVAGCVFSLDMIESPTIALQSYQRGWLCNFLLTMIELVLFYNIKGLT